MGSLKIVLCWNFVVLKFPVRKFPEFVKTRIYMAQITLTKTRERLERLLEKRLKGYIWAQKIKMIIVQKAEKITVQKITIQKIEKNYCPKA